jgi:hypothetical protein
MLNSLKFYILGSDILQLLMTGPKLVFSFWLAQTLIPAFDIALSKPKPVL